MKQHINEHNGYNTRKYRYIQEKNHKNNILVLPECTSKESKYCSNYQFFSYMNYNFLDRLQFYFKKYKNLARNKANNNYETKFNLILS